MRDEIIDFISRWSGKLKLPVSQFLKWISISPNRYYDIKKRYNKPNKHNNMIPKSHWLLPWEREAIIAYAKQHPFEGYRLLAYMMLDSDVVAVSPSSVYRVLLIANLLNEKTANPSKKGTGFVQPTKSHQHWHSDISYINIACTFYYLISVLDGYSRYLIHWELRKSMTEEDLEMTLQRAHEKFPKAKPRIISDNGPQYVSNDFKLFIRQMEMTHVTTSPYYPQSNGKQERFHLSLKKEGLRSTDLSNLELAQKKIKSYIKYYNEIRLHSAIGYVTPLNKLLGCEKNIFKQRKLKLNLAQQKRFQTCNRIN